MKCPNCGRTVRSKHQCAHCGYVFDKQDLQGKQRREVEEVQDFEPVERHAHEAETPVATAPEVIPKTSKQHRGGGVGGFIWGLVKLLLMVSLVFAAIFFGPGLVSQVTNYFNQNFNSSETAPLETTEETTVQGNTATGTNQSSKENTGATTPGNHTAQSGETSGEGQSNETPQGAALTLKDTKVNTEAYPIVKVEMEFENDLNQVTSDTFKFNLTSNGEAVKFDDAYSLIKDGKKVTLSYNDPSALVLSSDTKQQVLTVTADSLGFKKDVTYEAPQSNVNQAENDQFNEIINTNLIGTDKVTAIIQEVGGGKNRSFAYDPQTTDSDALIAWFIGQRTYQAIKDGDLTLDQIVQVNPDLLAKGDTGEMTTVAPGTEYTVESLLNLVIQRQDPSAMNHLIEATGGPNDFNLWLNESNYFATRITAQLSLDDNGAISGAVTNPKDLILLMENLAKNTLIDETYDEQFKTALLQTPLSNKFPEGNVAGLVRRFEVTSADANQKHQYYSGILETEDKTYLVVILDNDFTDAKATIDNIALTTNQVVGLLREGQVPEAEPTTTASPQVQIIGEETAAPTQPNPEYSVQPVDGQATPVLLPIIRDENGNPMQVQWYLDSATNTYKYR